MKADHIQLQDLQLRNRRWKLFNVLFMQTILGLFVENFKHTSAEQLFNSEDRIQEYCAFKEPFEARCLKTEVVVMKSAIYGRMRMGRCLEDEGGEHFQRNLDDPKFLGCSENVMYLMDKKCSGKYQCEVRHMMDSDFGRIKPCHAALKLYLEASYQCITVIESDHSCVVTASSNPSHIMHSSTSQLGCGTKSQPWVITAPIGQQINITRMQFDSESSQQITQSHNSCNRYGTVIDKSAGKNVSICGNDQMRHMIVCKSQSNVVEVILDVTVNEDITGLPRIVIGFQAIGCSNFLPPDESWLRRNENEATVGCYSSRQTWYLRCVGNQWIGVIGNCSRDILKLSEVVFEPKASAFNFNEVTIMVVVVFLTLIICLTIICCGAVCLKRHYSLSAHQHFNLIEENYKKIISTEDRQPHNKPLLVINESIPAS